MSKFSILRSNALKCLNHVIGSTDKKDEILDILSCVKVDVKSNIAIFTTTNLDMQSSDSSEVVSDGDFSFVAPVHQIMEVVKRLPDSAEIHFSVETKESGVVLNVKSGRFSFDVSILAAVDFPEMSLEDVEMSVTINAKKLSECIKKTQFSISVDEMRYNLTGIMMHIEDGILNFISTDGHRLSVFSIPAKEGEKLTNSIIPKRAIVEILKIATEFDEDVIMNFSQNKLQISVRTIKFATKLINGSFPDYKRVIPQGGDKTLVFSARDLEKAIQLVSGVSAGKDNKGLTFKISKDGIEISDKTDIYSVVEFVSAKFSGEDVITVRYNFKYVSDVLACISGDCLMKFTVADSPVFVTDASDEGKSMKYVIMPLK